METILLESSQLAKNTIKNSIWNIVGYLLLIVLGFITQPILFKYLGVEQVGIWGYLMSILTPLGLTIIGFSQAAIKYASQYYQEKDYEMTEKFISTTFFLNVLTGIILCIFFLVFGPWLFINFFHVSLKLQGITRISVYLLAFCILTSFTFNIFGVVPNIAQNFKFKNIGMAIVQTTTSIIIISSLLLGRSLISYMIGYLISLIINLVYWKRAAKKLIPEINIHLKFHKEVLDKALNFGILRFISESGNILIQQSERYIVGFFLNPQAGGIYNFPVTIQTQANTGLATISDVLFPAFSSYSKDSIENKANMLMRANWIIVLLTSSVIVPIIPLAHSILKLWINVEIANNAYIILQLYMLSLIFFCASFVSNSFFLGNAKTKWLSFISVSTSIIIIAVSIYLIPKYGVRYAGISAVVGMFYLFNLFMFFIKRFFKKDLSFGRMFTSIYIPVIISISLSLIFTNLGITVANNWFSLILQYIILLLFSLFITIVVSLMLPYRKEKYNDIKLLVIDIFLKNIKARFSH